MGESICDATEDEENQVRTFFPVITYFLGPEREEVVGAGEDFIMRSFIACMLHQILLG
jgi:hypothetical protein